MTGTLQVTAEKRQIGHINVVSDPSVPSTVQPGEKITITRGQYTSWRGRLSAPVTLLLNGTDVTADMVDDTYYIPPDTADNSTLTVQERQKVRGGFVLTRTASSTVTGPVLYYFEENTAVGAGAQAVSEADGTYGQFTMSGGVITPNTSPLTVGDVTVGSTTIRVNSGGWTVADNSELIAAMGSGRRIVCRGGSFGGGRASNVFKDRIFAAETVVTAYDRASTIFTDTWMEGTENLTLDGLSIKSNAGFTCLRFEKGNINAKVINCDISDFTPIDPTADYSAAPPDVVLHGIFTTGTTGEKNENLYVAKNHIHDCYDGTAFGHFTGVMIFEGNEVHDCYKDCVKFGYTPPIPTRTVIRDNWIYGTISNGGDFENPHSDLIQFTSTGNFSGIEIDRNFLANTHARSTPQAFFLSDNTAGNYYTAKIRGNTLANSVNQAAFGLRIENAKDCEVIGNTIAGSKLVGSGGITGIRIGEDTRAGRHVIRNNIGATINIFPQTIDSNNLEIGGPFDPIVDYETVFTAGGDFIPLEREDLINQYAMRAGGPSDADGQGRPNIENIGAIGTGYVDFPADKLMTGGSFDPAYAANVAPNIIKGSVAKIWPGKTFEIQPGIYPALNTILTTTKTVTIGGVDESAGLSGNFYTVPETATVGDVLEYSETADDGDNPTRTQTVSVTLEAEPAEYQKVLDLAVLSGAQYVYDPDNPNTRTLRDDGAGNLYYAAISDGLGNGPDMVMTVEAEQAQQVTLASGRKAMLGNGTHPSGMLTAASNFAMGADKLEHTHLLWAQADSIGTTMNMVRAVDGGFQFRYGGSSVQLYMGGTFSNAVVDTATTDARVMVSSTRSNRIIYRRNGVELHNNFVAADRTTDKISIGNNWIGKIGPVIFWPDQVTPDSALEQHIIDSWGVTP